MLPARINSIKRCRYEWQKARAARRMREILTWPTWLTSHNDGPIKGI
jgi:hypothetical protein